ncbi:DUF937 domain-containing protein [Comamonas sp. GB3 AK4-5]|uniref:DUF937 domain-containing protein n=1 Tax=Comamonas sp. GB3 AK4-5 TaxID=3231487 RepID=UPI00351EAB9D
MNTTSSWADELMTQLQGAPMQQMAQQLGMDSVQVQSAVATALPMMLGALGHNAQQPEGAAQLMDSLQQGQGAAMPQGLGGLGDLLGAVLGGGAAGGASQGGAADILGQIFGGSQQKAEAGLGQATGLGNQAGSLLQMLAPIVMAFLAQRVQAGGLDVGGLGQALGQEKARAQSQGGLGGGLLGSLLDQDGDGQVGLSDLIKIGGSLFGNRR